MITFPKEFQSQISSFQPLFGQKVFKNAIVLLVGAVSVVGRRTVCSALRAVGLREEKRFHKYHWVLSGAKWSCHKASEALLLLLVDYFFKGRQRLSSSMDETLERRWGSKIKARGIYRDAVRSSKSHPVKCSGLRWICVMLLTPIEWSGRVWSLPFLSVLAPSERYSQKHRIRHKKLAGKLIVIVADSSYATLELLATVGSHVSMITPLRLDAALYGFVPPRPAGRRGPNRKKGERLTSLKHRLDEEGAKWDTIRIPKWYGHQDVEMLARTGCAIWYKGGKPPVPVRWVLLKDPNGIIQSKALLCTNMEFSAQEVIDEYIKRWTIEVTFQEARAHLGLESQRQWSDKAIARTTPVLMALFSLVTIWADILNNKGLLQMESCAWYKKSMYTFSDAITAVRKHIWRENNFLSSVFRGDDDNLKTKWLRHLIFMATRAA